MIAVGTLGFRQCSCHLAIRVLPDGPLGGCTALRLSRQAVVPCGFRVQVGRVTQEHGSVLPWLLSLSPCGFRLAVGWVVHEQRTQLLLCCTGINRVVTRRTL